MVEKLLTNWLSICLYAFLRVSGHRGRCLLPSPRFKGAACGLTDPGGPTFPQRPRGMRARKGEGWV